MIELREGIDANKSKDSKPCIICHYWYFDKFQRSICNVCHDILMIRLGTNNIAIFNVKGIDYHCVIYGFSRSDAIDLLENSVLNDKQYT